MKYLVLIIILIVSSYAAQAQVEKIVSFRVPPGTERIDQQKLQLYLDKRSKTTIDLKKAKGQFYQADDILININADAASLNENLLEERKKAYDHLHAELKGENYYSEIKLINGNKCLIQRFERSNFTYYYFCAVNRTNNKIISGKFEFNKPDETKAKTVLNHILNSIKFK